MLACQPVAQDTGRYRAAISGRVILVDERGSTISAGSQWSWAKVRAAPADEDGVFLSDLEPDVYEVRIIYSGGLTADASGSAYQEFNRRVYCKKAVQPTLEMLSWWGLAPCQAL